MIIHCWCCPIYVKRRTAANRRAQNFRCKEGNCKNYNLSFFMNKCNVLLIWIRSVSSLHEPLLHTIYGCYLSHLLSCFRFYCGSFEIELKIHYLRLFNGKGVWTFKGLHRDHYTRGGRQRRHFTNHNCHRWRIQRWAEHDSGMSFPAQY